MQSNSKQKILQNIQQALKTSVPVPFKPSHTAAEYTADADDGDVLFASNFTALSGQFAYYENDEQLVAGLMGLLTTKGIHKVFCNDKALIALIMHYAPGFVFHADLSSCEASITGCEALVARTGSIVFSSTANGRSPSVYAPMHICIAYTDQVVHDVSDALEGIQQKYNERLPSVISFASGPSRTADIEKTLVIGIHGPQEVYCLLAERVHRNQNNG